MDMTVASLSLAHAHGAPSVVPEESVGPCLQIDIEDRSSDGQRFAAEVRDFGPVRVARVHDRTGVWSICIERALLAPLLAGMPAPLQRRLDGDDPALRLLRGYLAALFALDQDYDPTLAATHIRELALSALGVRGDVQALVRDGGVHAARQSAVLQVIGERAAEPSLNPTEVARQSGISVRYLHQLLESTGRTFSQHLLEQRLQRALAALRNPHHRGRIADIACACGFCDISHFNRSFRRAFGDTPHGVRVRSARAQADTSRCAAGGHHAATSSPGA
jgi:AraC-like DNA-binding protein